MLQLRPFEPRDLAALYAISLATGLAGGDASQLYRDGQLIGHIYAGPYARLLPDRVRVVEDDDGVGGFVLGALDTVSWEGQLELACWPDLRLCYPLPIGAPSDWTVDERRRAMIHHPVQTPADVVRDYPAHLHLNILPRLQRQGVGPMLLDVWLSLASEQGVNAVHVGVNYANAGALRFWARQGFQVLATANKIPRTIWMGRRIVERGRFTTG